MAESTTIPARNGQPAALADVPNLPVERLRRAVIEAVAGGARIAALFGLPAGRAGGGSAADTIRLFAVLAHDERSSL